MTRLLHHLKTIGWLFFFWLLVCTGWAQSPIKIEYTVEDGLSSPTVLSIHEDRLGRLWFSTPNGICRYDSREFVRFGTDEGLSDPYIIQVKEDTNGTIWCVSKVGALFYSKDGRQFHPHPLNDKMLKRFNAPTPVDIYPFSSDSIIMTQPHRHFEITQDSICEVYLEVAYARHLKDQETASQKANIVGRFRQVGDVFSCNISPRNDLPNRAFITEMGSGRVDTIHHDLGTLHAHYHFARIYGDTLFVSHGPLLLGVYHGKVFFSFHADSYITNSIQLLNGKLYFGTYNHGLYEFPSVQRADRYHRYFKDSRIYYLHQDLEGSLWVATQKDGLYYVPNLGFKEKRMEGSFNALTQIAGDKTELVIATSHGAILELDSTMQHMDTLVTEALLSRKTTLSQYTWVMGYGTGKKGHLLVGKRPDGGLDYIDPPISIIRSDQFSEDGWLFMCSHSNIYRAKDYDLKRDPEKLATAMPVNDVLALSDTSFFALCDNGFYLWDEQQLTLMPNPPMAKSIFRINSGLIHDGMLFLATHGNEVVVYQLEGEQHPTFLQKIPCSGKYISFILEDEGEIWFGSEMGLSKLIKQGNTYSEFNIHTATGLPIVQVNDMYSYAGTFYLATSNGIQVLPKEDLKHLEYRFAPIDIANVLLNDREVDRTSAAGEFDYFKGLIGFKISTISYKKRNQLRYQYRLMPADSNWISSVESRIQFSSLEPGEYIFQVRSANSALAPKSEYQFTIRAPFWLTAWFRTLLVLVVAALIIGPITWWIRESRIKAQHELDFNQLKLSSVSAQMNPHFVFNSMNSIHSFVLKNDNIKSAQYLSRFSQLIRSILDNSLKSLVPLSQSLDAIDRYVELEQLRFNNKFCYEKYVDPDLPENEVLVPPLLLQPFVENAILHGLVPKSESGTLSLRVVKEENKIIVDIEDDGIGLEASKSNPNRSGLLHMGHGSNISRERIALYNRLFNAPIKLTYKDLSNGHNVKSGTRVRLEIPLEKPFLA